VAVVFTGVYVAVGLCAQIDVFANDPAYFAPPNRPFIR
jgi:hypothetical protein